MRHDGYGRALTSWLRRNKIWWPIGSLVAFFLYMGWRYAEIEPGYVDTTIYGSLMFVMLFSPAFLAPTLAIAQPTAGPISSFLLGTLRFLRVKEDEVTALLEMLFMAFHLTWTCGLLLVLARANEWTANWLIKSGRPPDKGVLIVCLLLTLLAAYNATAYAFQAYLASRRGLKGREVSNRLRTVEEAAWFFGLLAIALVPAAIRASVVPNLLLGVIVPVIVFYSRVNRVSPGSPQASASDSGREDHPSVR